MTVSLPTSPRLAGGNPSVARPAAALAYEGGVRLATGRGRGGETPLESGLTLDREDGFRTIAQAGGADPGP